ncbi:hypothetical protein H633G_11383 [Metarhizium anisopliae BRIP 53284]|nr:hypothetical protein H633G_11383 [Metarhizium anisopliae BRIP 53284]
MAHQKPTKSTSGGQNIVAVKGRFLTTHRLTHRDLSKKIKACGGIFVPDVQKRATHIVVDDNWAKSGDHRLKGFANLMPVDWILASENGEFAETAKYRRKLNTKRVNGALESNCLDFDVRNVNNKSHYTCSQSPPEPLSHAQTEPSTSLSSNGQFKKAPTPPNHNQRPPPLPHKNVTDVSVRIVYDVNRIIRLLGQGSFETVVQAHDNVRNQAVAIKVIRSLKEYRDAARIELRVLATLEANDTQNLYQCIHWRDCFEYRGHICIVTDLLCQSISDFLKGNNFVPFPNSHIQNFARQLFKSVAFLHDLNLIHADLKPENILLCEDAYQTFTYNRNAPSSSWTVERWASQRRVLLDTEIRLIDFGLATFQNEYHSPIVSTRCYRAPEIILGLGWSFPCDIWSVGCILVELLTGYALFDTRDDLEHLAMMEAVVGSRINSHLIQTVKKMSRRNSGNSVSKFFKNRELDYPNPDTTPESVTAIKAMKQLEAIMPSSSQFFIHFLDLLKKIFVYDPANRITATQALHHPWFDEVSQPDDGTEAAKIGLERKVLEQSR